MNTLSDHLERARLVSERAYAPYSRYQVGAVLLATSGAVYDGVNVENASYGGTICAERMALGAAVTAEGPALRLRQVTVHTTSSPPAAPCGLCLQVLSEFCGTDTRVVCGNHQGEVRSFSFGELLPQAFHGHEITPVQG
jgi:homotetrameric cytidine deaminase